MVPDNIAQHFICCCKSPVKYCPKDSRQHSTGKNQCIAVCVSYNLVFSFNIGPGFFFFNIVEICARLAQHLQQPVIIRKLTGPKYKSPKSDAVQTTMHWPFSCTVLLGVSWVIDRVFSSSCPKSIKTTLNRSFSCAMLSQEYWDNIEQHFSYAMLSGDSWTTLNRFFYCAMLSHVTTLKTTLNSIKTTLNIIFSCAMLYGDS